MMKKGLTALALVLVMLIGLSGIALAGTTNFYITAPDATFSGYNFSVELAVSDITDLYGASIDMVYDPELVQVDDVILTDVFGGETVNTLVSDIDNETGELSYCWSLTGDVSGADIVGSTTLITVECTAVNTTDGSWAIDVTNLPAQELTVSGDNTRILLSDSNADSIAISEPTHTMTFYELFSDGDYDYKDNGDTTCSIVAYNGSEGSITLPSSLNGITATSIWDNAFDNSSALLSVTIPDSITSIGAEAFYGCSSLTCVYISDSVTSIGTDAFASCNASLIVYGPLGCYAETYCDANGITYYGYIPMHTARE